jgi:hypothetical protein
VADELNVAFDVPGPPQHVMGEWRQNPPVLGEDGFEVVDESFNSITYEHRYLDWPQKLLIVCTFGVALLFKGFMESVFRVTARFDEEGANTRILLIGHAHPRTQEGLAEVINENGGITGPPTPSFTATLLPGSPPS